MDLSSLDYVVLGGGSGGLASARRAARCQGGAGGGRRPGRYVRERRLRTQEDLLERRGARALSGGRWRLRLRLQLFLRFSRVQTQARRIRRASARDLSEKPGKRRGDVDRRIRAAGD